MLGATVGGRVLASWSLMPMPLVRTVEVLAGVLPVLVPGVVEDAADAGLVAAVLDEFSPGGGAEMYGAGRSGVDAGIAPGRSVARLTALTEAWCLM